jgi:hypothetical protein
MLGHQGDLQVSDLQNCEGASGNSLNRLKRRELLTWLRILGLMTIWASIAVAVGASALADAQTQDNSKKSKRTQISFENELIEGQRSKPDLFVVLQNRMNNSRRLFKLRENFLPEMRKTAEDVGRQSGRGSGN